MARGEAMKYSRQIHVGAVYFDLGKSATSPISAKPRRRKKKKEKKPS